jgi:hypothetical protein
MAITYNIERREGAGSYAPFLSAITAPPQDDNTVLPSTEYQYRIQSEENGLTSPWVESNIITTPAEPFVPGEVTYNIERKVNDGPYAPFASGVVSPPAEDTTTSGENRYKYRIQSQQDGLLSSWTESNEVTTPARPVVFDIETRPAGGLWTRRSTGQSGLTEYSLPVTGFANGIYEIQARSRYPDTDESTEWNGQSFYVLTEVEVFLVGSTYGEGVLTGILTVTLPEIISLKGTSIGEGVTQGVLSVTLPLVILLRGESIGLGFTSGRLRIIRPGVMGDDYRYLGPRKNLLKRWVNV